MRSEWGLVIFPARSTLIRGVAALAIAVAAGSVTACESTQNKAACKKISSDLQNVLKNMDTSDPNKGFSDAATKIRNDASGASGDVKSSADAVADDYAQLAKSSSDNAQPDTNRLGDDAKKLGTACGGSMYVPNGA